MATLPTAHGGIVKAVNSGIATYQEPFPVPKGKPKSVFVLLARHYSGSAAPAAADGAPVLFASAAAAAAAVALALVAPGQHMLF